MKQYSLGRKIILVALLICVSCSTIDIWDLENAYNPLVNLPNFIEKSEIINSENAWPYKKAVCLTINQEKLWEKSNTYDQLQNQLISTMKLKVDNNHIGEFYLVTPALTVIRNKIDENGSIIGTYTDPFTACFDMRSINKGIHIAYFAIKSVSGDEHTFTWQFDLE